jgi:hypothetical protein
VGGNARDGQSGYQVDVPVQSLMLCYSTKQKDEVQSECPAAAQPYRQLRYRSKDEIALFRLRAPKSTIQSQDMPHYLMGRRMF